MCFTEMFCQVDLAVLYLYKAEILQDYKWSESREGVVFPCKVSPKIWVSRKAVAQGAQRESAEFTSSVFFVQIKG